MRRHCYDKRKAQNHSVFSGFLVAAVFLSFNVYQFIPVWVLISLGGVPWTFKVVPSGFGDPSNRSLRQYNKGHTKRNL